MAYQMNQNRQEEHPFKTIRKVMTSAAQTGAYPGVMLLYGSEDYLVRWAEGYIKDSVVMPAVEALDCIRISRDGVSCSEIISACETLPFMSPRKLVIVESELLFSSSKENGSDLSNLASYIPGLADTTLLVLVCSKPNKTRALYKACEKHGLVFDFSPLDDGTLKGWIRKRLAQSGKKGDPDMFVRFARACGYGEKDSSYTLTGLENDLKKVIALSAGAEITRQELFAIYTAPPQTDVFRLLDSAFSGKKEEAYRILSDSLDLQQASKAMGVVLGFIGLLCSQLEIMTEGAERRAEGQDIDMMAGSMGVNPYRLKKAMETASKRTIPRLRADLYSAYQMEKDIKNGVMEPRLALELFIAGL